MLVLIAGLRLTLALVGFAIVAAKLPAEPFYVIAVVGASSPSHPSWPASWPSCTGSRSSEIRDEMTLRRDRALPFAVLRPPLVA